MKRHIQYSWWKYAAAILASVILWCSVFHGMTVPEGNQKLHILYVGEGLDCTGFKNSVAQVLPTVSEQEIQEIKVQQVQIYGMDAFKLLDSYTYQYDIIIISQSYFQENMGLSILSRAMTEQMLTYFREAEPMIELYEGKPAVCGFVMGKNAEQFYQYGTNSSICYIFPSSESVNFAGLNGKGTVADDCALRIMEYLLGIC